MTTEHTNKVSYYRNGACFQYKYTYSLFKNERKYRKTNIYQLRGLHTIGDSNVINGSKLQ